MEEGRKKRQLQREKRDAEIEKRKRRGEAEVG